MPFQLLRVLPLVNQARVPGRFTVMVMLVMSVLVALAMARLIRGASLRRSVTISVFALGAVLFELWPAPYPLSATTIPKTHLLITERDDSRAVLEVPFGFGDGTGTFGVATPWTQFYQSSHRKPLVNAYIGRIQPSRWALVRREPFLETLVRLQNGELTLEKALERCPDETVDHVLSTFSVGYVSVDRRLAREETREFVRQSLGRAPDASADGYALFLLP
jgi:hypothetical protein